MTSEPSSATLRPQAEGGQAESVGQAAPAGSPTVTESPGPHVAHDSRLPEVPGYQVLGVLGRGGMGVVYKARQLNLNRTVALKMILPGEEVGPEDLARFRAEAEAVAQLRHPNIVAIYEVGDLAGRPFLSLEYVEGGNLAQKLKGTPLPAGDAARLAATLARAVDCAHRQQIIHRDLKPANILLQTTEYTEHTEKGGNKSASHFSVSSVSSVVKITDFGLAKRLDQETGHTQTGEVMGTPSYMAPEQAEGRVREVGPAADVYALGAILYELLTGRPPFRAATAVETLVQVKWGEPVPVRRLQPAVPRDLEAVCLKCLEKVVRNRYGSALALAEDLERFLAGEPTHARPVGVAGRAVKWARRRPAAAALVAVSALAVLSLAAGGLLYEEQRAQQAEQELRDHQRLEDARVEAQVEISRAELAGTTGAWGEAEVHASRALGRIGAEPSLVDLHARAQRLQEQAAGRLHDQAARRAALALRARFGHARDDALFHMTLLTGLNLTTNLDKARAAAEEALGLFQVPGGAAPWQRPPHFTEAEWAEVTRDCYELLLFLAGAVAHQAPGHKEDGSAAQALRLLERAAALQPPTKAYHLRRARCFRQLGKAAQADQERALADRLTPTGAGDHFLVGTEWYQQGDLDRAVESFQGALRARPDHFWAQYYLAVCALKRTPARPAEAVAYLSACLSLHPDDFPWAYVLRGFAESELGEFAAAAADFEKALALARPDDEAAQYSIRVNLGILHMRRGNLAAAAADLDRAIARKPGQAQAYTARASVYEKQQRLDLAVAELGTAIRLEPSQARLHSARARLFMGLKDRPAALRDLETAIELEPAGSTSLGLANDRFHKGRLLHAGRHYREAADAYEEALRTRPEPLQAQDAALNPRPDYLQAHRLRGEALLRLAAAEVGAVRRRLYEEAVRSLTQHLQTVGTEADVFRQRGEALARLGNHAGAVDDYTRALQLEADAATYAARGWLYLAFWEAPKLGLHDFEEALRLNSASGDAHNGRGYARVLRGDYEGAVADADKAVKLGPLTSRTLYNAARVYAQAAGKVETAMSRPTSALLARRLQYQDRALQLLSEAVELHPAGEQRRRFWRDTVQPDPALDPVRLTTAFSRLAAAYK